MFLRLELILDWLKNSIILVFPFLAPMSVHILCYWFAVQAVTLVRKLRNFSLPEIKLKKLEFFLRKFPLCLSNQPNKILSIPIQYWEFRNKIFIFETLEMFI